MGRVEDENKVAGKEERVWSGVAEKVFAIDVESVSRDVYEFVKLND